MEPPIYARHGIDLAPAGSWNRSARSVKLHLVERTNPVDREVAAKAMGYSGLSGRSATILSNLSQYGLLARTAKSEVRVTQRAIDILFPDTEASQAAAMREAALEPDLFKRITDRFTDGLPSETALEAYLIRQGFTHTAVQPATRAFRGTFLYLENMTGSESYPHATPDVVESQPKQQVERQPAMTLAQQTPKALENSTGMVPSGAAAQAFKNVTKPIFDFESVSVYTVIDNRRDLRELIERLEKLEAMLPEGAEPTKAKSESEPDDLLN